MKSKKDINIWDPNETVYKAGDKSVSAYLVLDGSAEIISADGVKLNSFGPNELFGEASLVLKSDRTVSVVAGPSGLSAKVISSANLRKRLQKDVFLSALVRKLETRLIAANQKIDTLSQKTKKSK
jgi:CRP-like cAMP-binding protein|tara:strand:+ start:123 stop:497 length:375 start_codon:yes stop_codon:yes gene_type:complete